MKVFQHLTEFHDGDGVGNDTKGFHLLFQKMGWDSTITFEKTSSVAKDLPLVNISSVNLENFPSDAIHIFHYAGSGLPQWMEILDRFDHCFLRFHNFTPAHFFFHGFGEGIAEAMKRAEDKAILELASYRSRIVTAICDSRENKKVLEEIGYMQAKVFPIVHPLWVENQDFKIERKLDPNKLKLGFVGRFVPNKCWEDCIHLLSCILALNPEKEIELHCIGNCPPVFQAYMDSLNDLVHKRNLNDRVFFYKGLSDPEVRQEVSTWNWFVSMSEHEGFGIPLLEAFSLSVPVIAYAKAAVPETMRGGGILVHQKDFWKIAGLILEIDGNQNQLQRLIETQNKVFSQMQNYPYETYLKSILQSDTLV